MKNPKWQRARIVRAELNPSLLGLFLWTRTGPPVEMVCRRQDTKRKTVGPRVRTNILEIDAPHRPLVCHPKGIERLARDKHDFADDVPLVKWEDWVRESTPER